MKLLQAGTMVIIGLVWICVLFYVGFILEYEMYLLLFEWDVQSNIWTGANATPLW